MEDLKFIDKREVTMEKVTMLLIGFAALGFLFAIFSVFFDGVIFGIGAEAFSRACTNLALIAIAITLWSKKASD